MSKMKIIIPVSGKKGSGKNTFVNQLVAAKLNALQMGGDQRTYTVNALGRLEEHSGESVREMDLANGRPDWHFLCTEGIRLLSFADPLKRFCIDVLGLHYEQCYGTDDEKNTYTKLSWINAPNEGWWKAAPGDPNELMTAREVMQWFGTDVMRAWEPNIWVDACVRTALTCEEPLVLLSDCRFPNEVDCWAEVADEAAAQHIMIRTVRLLRAPYADTDQHESETALDDYPLENFSAVVPDCNGVDAQGVVVNELRRGWLTEAGWLA
jgi:hypothetical protein